MREDERTWERKVLVVVLFVANLPTANIVVPPPSSPPAVVLTAVPIVVSAVDPHAVVLLLRVAALAGLGPVYHVVQHDYGRWW